MSSVRHDVRHAVRQLVKRPGFSVAAVLTLALGIGANTAIFSVVHGVMLRPAPFPQPDRLAIVHTTASERGGASDRLAWSYPLFQDFVDRVDAFESVGAFTEWNPTLNLTGTAVPDRVRAEFASAGYFQALGVRAQLGRVFLTEEDAVPQAAPVVLLSHAVWRGKFGGDTEIVGREIQLNERTLTVVGVLPPGFDGLSGAADVWLPMTMAPAFLGERRLTMRYAFWHAVVARLAPDVTWEQARAQLSQAGRALGEGFEMPGGAQLGLAGQRLSEWRVDSEIRAPLLVLLGAVAFVLLIACANIANLVMSRAVARRRDLAVRAALGANRAGLLRLLLAESLVLGLVGGAVGLLLALWGVDLLAALKPAGLTAIDFGDVRLDATVLLFNLGISAAAGVLFGLLPGLQVYRASLNEALHAGGDRALGGALSLRRPSARAVMVAGEVALAMVLLVGAGLALRSFAEMRGTELGFRPQGTLTARISLPRQSYSSEAAVGFLNELQVRFASTADTDAVAVANCLPLSDGCDRARMTREDESAGEEAPGRDVVVNMVDEDFFQTLEIPVIRGRTFTAADREGNPRVAVINLTAALRYWPGEDPIGSRIRLSVGWPEGDYAEIVGVVGDVRYADLDQEVAPTVYLPYRQFMYHANYFLTRADGTEPGALVEPLRAAVLGLDSNLPIFDVRTLESRVGDVSSRARFSASLLATFAAIALALAAVGVYAVMTFAVSGRTREIGLRMAVGAGSKDVLRLVLRDSAALTLIGLGVGLAASLGLTRFLAGQLYGVEPTDAWTYMAVTGLLALTALVAAWLPARRAARVDPLIALRHE